MRHWCWQTLTHRQIRKAPAEARLAALAIAAGAELSTRTATIDAAAFARTCAVRLPVTDQLLTALADTGWIRSWNHNGNGLLHIAIGDAPTVLLPHGTPPETDAAR